MPDACPHRQRDYQTGRARMTTDEELIFWCRSKVAPNL